MLTLFRGRAAATSGGGEMDEEGRAMDERKLAELMGRLVADMGGAAMVASIIVGEELGLYRAMADGRPVSADELAAATGCHPRLVLEWLNAQAASGYDEFDDGT